MTSFSHDQAGSAAALVAIGLTVIVGAAAFAVDLSYNHMVQGRLQTVADAAALAAAREVDKRSTGQIRQYGAEFAMRNAEKGDGIVTEPGDVVPGSYDPDTRTFAAGAMPYNAVKVTAHRAADRENAVPAFFAGIFGRSQTNLSASAIAMLTGPRACVYALSPNANRSVYVQGTARLTVPDCGIQVNSSAPEAMRTQGGQARISSKENCVVGGWSGRISPAPEHPPDDCTLSPDPLAGLPEPSKSGPCYMQDVTISDAMTLPANKKYCGTIQITGGAQVQLEEGTYYFYNASLEVNQQAELVGDGVMLYFDRSSSFEMNAAGDLILSPPTEGPYTGVSIFASRNANSTAESTLGGSRRVQVTGTVYTPRMDLLLRGSPTLEMAVEAGYIVANTFRFQGAAEGILRMPASLAPKGMGEGAVLVR